jgi:preprotein translocase subunit SecG
MTLVFFILIGISCFILGLVILVQNPKGGGLAGSIGGFNNQFMGVKQTNDVLEKGTWLFATIIGILCIISTVFFKGGTAASGSGIVPTFNQSSQPATPPAGTQKTPATPTDTSKH